jgi:protein arginine kinase
MNPLLKEIGQKNHPIGGADELATSITFCLQVALSRNIQEFTFPRRASNDELREVHALVAAAVRQEFPSYDIHAPATFSAEDRKFFIERKWAAKIWGRRDDVGGIIASPSASVVLTTNGEDHICIRHLRSGLDISEAFSNLHCVETALAKHLPFAFNAKLGYLASNVQNCGFVSQIKAFLHLPGLVSTKQLRSSYQLARTCGYAMCGTNGRKTPTDGEIFFASHTFKLDDDMSRAADAFYLFIQSVNYREQEARLSMVQDVASRLALRNRLSRALALIKNSYAIGLREARSLLMDIRLANDLSYMDGSVSPLVDRLYVELQPQHLHCLYGDPGQSLANEDELRAEILRDKFKNFLFH